MPDARKPPSESGGLFTNNCPAAGLDEHSHEVSLKIVSAGDRARPGPKRAAVADDNGGDICLNNRAQPGANRAAVADDASKLFCNGVKARPGPSRAAVADDDVGQSGVKKARIILNAQTVNHTMAQGNALEEDGEEGRGCPRNLYSDTLGRHSADNVGTPTAPQERGQSTAAATADDEPTMCTACGHNADSGLCCKFKSHSKRAGERQRQVANRAKRQRDLLVEEASRRPRIIHSVDDAVTPAQKALAKIRERIAQK